MKNKLALLLAASVAACATAPDAPSLRPTPPTWSQPAAALAEESVSDLWWRAYGDDILTRLIEEAGDIDDVALAEARLAEARAGLRSARSAFLPNIAASASADESQSGDGIARTDTTSGGVSVGLSLDLFGADRARSGAARSRAQAAEAELAAARLATRATTAELYIAVRNAQAQGRAARRTVASLADTLNLAQARRTAGLAPELEPAQARAALAVAEARPPALAQAELSARLALETLLGFPPGGLAPLLAEETPIPNAAVERAALAPMDVLARRPDLIAAERALTAAGYESRAARADFWPKLSLSGFYGEQRVSPTTPFSADGVLSSAAAGLSAPLFSFGRLEGARDASDARLRQAAIRYRQAAANALADVERALGAARDAEARQEALTRARSAAADQAQLARSRYSAGLVPLLEVLAAERAVDEADLSLAQAQADSATAYANLSARMGLGGAFQASMAK